MKHKISILLLYLLLGSFVTIAVAWSCTLWSPRSLKSRPLSSRQRAGWIGYGSEWNANKAVGWAHRFNVPEGSPFFSSVDVAGLPAYAMHSRVTEIYDPSGYRKRWELPLSEILARGLNTSDLPSFLLAQKERRLALIPLWPGFLLDTLLYAALLFTLNFFLRPLTRFRRWQLSHEKGFPIQTTKPESETSPTLTK